jgi:hypothetical protein
LPTRFVLPILFIAIFPAVAVHAADGDEVGHEQECPLDRPPPGWEFEIGYGRGNKTEALAGAREEAFDRLINKVCSGLSPARCDGIRRSVRPWSTAGGVGEHYDKKRGGWACAVEAVPQAELTRMAAEAAALDRGISAMAAEVAKAEVALLRHEAPIWDGNGCGAGVVGEYLRQQFNGSLKGVQVDLDGQTNSTATRFQMRLAGSSSDVKVVGYKRRPNDPGWETIDGPTFALDLFGIETKDEVVDCRSDAALDLVGGERMGDGGLLVWLELPEGRNTFCEGESLAPVVRVNRPARVQVYSVLRDGAAHLVWPFEGNGLVDGAEELFDGELLADEAAGDESLVAVAVPQGGEFTRTRGWHGYCLASDDFGASFYPPGAAVGRVSYTVRPQGSDCPPTDVSDSQGKYTTAPRCTP